MLNEMNCNSLYHYRPGACADRECLALVCGRLMKSDKNQSTQNARLSMLETIQETDLLVNYSMCNTQITICKALKIDAPDLFRSKQKLVSGVN